MKKRIRTAVAGAGFIGPVHIEALRRLGIEIAGILGITPDEGRQAAERLNIERVYTTYEEICKDPLVDVIHICTPNYAHYNMARAALTAGKHIVVEKPMATRASDAHELVRLAQSSRLVAAVAFNWRYYPLIQEARARVFNGEVGRVHTLRGEYNQDWLCLPSDWNWRIDPELSGGLRAVSDLSTQWLDLMTWITGLSVTSVIADMATFIPIRYKPRVEPFTYSGKLGTSGGSDAVQVTTEDYASILLTYTGGARGSVSVSEVTPGRKNHFWWEIGGSLATLSWEQERPNEMWIGHREHPNQVLSKDPALMHPEARAYAAFPGGHAEGFPDTYTQLFKDVYAAIEGGDPNQKPTFPTLEDGWRNVTLLEKIRHSVDERRWVEVKPGAS